MREYRFLIQEPLRYGLRRSDEASLTSVDRSRSVPPGVGLLNCINFRVTEHGLRQPTVIESPFASPPDRVGVFPQLFIGIDIALLAYETDLYIVDTELWTHSLHVQTWDAADRSRVKAIPSGGGQWHFADFGPTWLLFNEVCVVYRTHREGVVGAYDKVCVNDLTKMTTGCVHRDMPGSGRLIFGGFEPSFFWPDAWNARWNSWWQKTAIASLGDPRAELPSNFVGWTSIGAGDLEFWVDVAFARQGVVSEDTLAADETKDLYLEYLERNELGFIPMPWTGSVLRVKSLGDEVIVYGEQGVSALVPAGKTFGVRHIMSVGCTSRGAVGGDITQHIFIDTAGKMWRLRPGQPIEELDYEEHLADVVDMDVAIQYHPQLREFYITGIDPAVVLCKVFTLTEQGLSKAPYRVITSSVFYDGSFIGVCDNLSAGGALYRTCLLWTDRTDLGTRKQKTITRLELGLDAKSGATVQAGVDSRDSLDASFEAGAWESVNDNGEAHIGQSGIEFKIKVQVSTNEDVKLDYIRVWYAYTTQR